MSSLIQSSFSYVPYTLISILKRKNDNLYEILDGMTVWESAYKVDAFLTNSSLMILAEAHT